MAAEPAARRRWGVGAALVLVVGAAAVTVGVGMVRQVATPIDVVAPATAGVTAPTVAAAPVYVHVAGAVRTPGLYRMSAGARVVDAVAAAGGLADDADPAGVNLARAVSDGEQLVVPRIGEAASAVPGAEGGPAARADGKVDLNTADAAALDTLPRIGPAIAARIIAWRDEHGRFTSVEDLLAIPGIGPKLLEGLRDLVVV